MENLLKKFDYIIGAVALCAFFLLIIELSSYFSHFTPLINKANTAILFLFILDVLLRFISSKDKKIYLSKNWIDLIVFVPLIQFIHGIGHAFFYTFIWQVVIVIMLLSRTRKANKFIALLSLKPAQLMVTSFSFAIGIGTVLLMLPLATKTGIKTPFVDAFFTATSAACVTGLAVKDTAVYFSIFGQLVILALIQVGGLGIMTFSVSLALFARKGIEARREIILQDVLDQDALSDVRNILVFIIKMTLFFEFIGAVLLFIAWKGKLQGFFSTFYNALFHSISAFCNAGFSTFSDNLMGFSGDVLTNLTICLLIISGGLGFTVIKDLCNAIKANLIDRSPRIFRLKTQTKIVLSTSILLIVIGAGLIYFFENSGAFTYASQKEKILMSLFQSISARTAGFNTCDIARLSSPTLFFLTALMFIGASPGSTAGGIKTTTVSVLWATIKSGFKQRENVELFKRTIPPEVIQKAITVFVFSIILVGVFTMFLLFIEKKLFMDILFETTSAFGTVGLSTGITSQLSGKAKLVITLLMFIGRLGPLTVAYAIARYKKPAKYAYAQEKVMIG